MAITPPGIHPNASAGQPGLTRLGTALRFAFFADSISLVNTLLIFWACSVASVNSILESISEAKASVASRAELMDSRMRLRW